MWGWSHFQPRLRKTINPRSFQHLMQRDFRSHIGSEGQTIINYVLPVRWWYLSLIYSIFLPTSCMKRVFCFVMWRWSSCWCSICHGLQKKQFSDLFPSHIPLFPRGNIERIHRKSVKVVWVNQSLITRNIKSSIMFDMQLKLNCKQDLNLSKPQPHVYLAASTKNPSRHDVPLQSRSRKKSGKSKGKRRN